MAPVTAFEVHQRVKASDYEGTLDQSTVEGHLRALFVQGLVSKTRRRDPNVGRTGMVRDFWYLTHAGLAEVSA